MTCPCPRYLLSAQHFRYAIPRYEGSCHHRSSLNLEIKSYWWQSTIQSKLFIYIYMIIDVIVWMYIFICLLRTCGMHVYIFVGWYDRISIYRGKNQHSFMCSNGNEDFSSDFVFIKRHQTVVYGDSKMTQHRERIALFYIYSYTMEPVHNTVYYSMHIIQNFYQSRT